MKLMPQKIIAIHILVHFLKLLPGAAQVSREYFDDVGDDVDNISSDAVIYRKEVFGITFEIFDGEEPADAAYLFALDYDITDEYRHQMVIDACKRVTCMRTVPLLFDSLVTLEESRDPVGTIEIYEGDEPADVAYEFAQKYGLSYGYQNAILSEACDYVECTRLEAIIWGKSVNINGETVILEVLEGEEPADIIYDTLEPLDVSWRERQKVMQIAIDDEVEFTRKFALVHSAPVTVDNRTVLGTVDFFDDGIEPIDSLYDFILDHDLEAHMESIIRAIIPLVCSNLSCYRDAPIMWAQDIVDENDENIGAVEILYLQEPVDAVDTFIISHGLSLELREIILQQVCVELECSRSVPIVFRQMVSDENGDAIGAIEIMEGEEVIDAVVRFIRIYRPPADEIALKNLLFQKACPSGRVKCTRNVAVIFEERITLDDSENPPALLTIYENQEPADIVYSWCQEKNIDLTYFPNLVETVCSSEIVSCGRRAPLIYGPQTISDKDGERIGVFQVEMFQEPIDAIYRFFAKHGLFQKKWEMLDVLDQFCSYSQLEGKCNRRKAIKYSNRSFENFGNLVIWEDEEVIDKLYRFRRRHNLTLEDQMESFAIICQDDEVYCERTRAIILEVKNLNWKEYDKFGNSTCTRQYAGWQHIAPGKNGHSAFREWVLKQARREFVKQSIEDPLFGPTILILALLASFCVTRLPLSREKRKWRSEETIFLAVVTFCAISFIYNRWIEPFDILDEAMYAFEGKLPDLHIYEGDEPVDAVMNWVKETSKEHHPLAREPIHWQLIEEVCRSPEVNCTRTRAWEPIDMGEITFFRQPHKIIYMNPGVDPIARKSCIPIMEGKADSCLREKAAEVCSRLVPSLNSCVNDITLHMASQLKIFEERRSDHKNTYIKLGLEMDVGFNELFKKTAYIMRNHGVNFSPYARVDNGTDPYPRPLYSHDRNYLKAWGAYDAYMKVKDPESREWNDKPCTPMFNGALCGKTDKDGNMKIEM